MIELLQLQDLSEALVFSLGVEARKRLTINPSSFFWMNLCQV